MSASASVKTNDPELPPKATPEPSSKLTLEPATAPRNLAALKRLNSLLLPIPYSTRFYKEITTSRTVGDLTRVALFDGQIVGAIRARLEEDGKSIYVMTLCTLSPFRRLGVGKMLLEYIVEKAREWGGVESVWAHVWEMNEDAREWYQRRGFEVGDVVAGYYRKLRPDGARVVRLAVGSGDGTAGS